MLRGSTVLQIDEVSDIATQYEERIKFADNARRCLRFRLTDGVNSVAAIECVRVPQLSIATAPGSKLLLTDVPISRRILLLSPGNCRLLGGAVRALYDAQAAVRLAEASRVTVLPQPLAARPVPQLAAAPPPPPPPRQMQMNDDASVHGTPEQFLVPARQYDDDEFDLNAFLAAENEALHVQKRLRSANDEARSNTTIDLNEEDVDDLVRVVTQVPDSSSDSEDFEKPTTKAKATTMTTTTTTITTASTKMIDLDLCDDDDDCDVTTFGLFG